MPQVYKALQPATSPINERSMGGYLYRIYQKIVVYGEDYAFKIEQYDNRVTTNAWDFIREIKAMYICVYIGIDRNQFRKQNHILTKWLT